MFKSTVKIIRAFRPYDIEKAYGFSLYVHIPCTAYYISIEMRTIWDRNVS